ncbi:MAG: type II toxin-antitoxin system HicA family toxin [Magnetococcales bacterium]|nr:type II toxin-antitoxin system HicA family toxin [Magnetococcales bacterium]
MSSPWPACKARLVLAALLRLGWRIKRQTGSHRTLEREGWADVVFAFRDQEDGGFMICKEMAGEITISCGPGYHKTVATSRKF